MEIETSTNESNAITQKSSCFKVLFAVILPIILILTVLIGGGVLYILNQPSSSFTSPTVITIEPGTSVKQITKNFEQQSLVRSATFLYLVLTTSYEPENIKASTYVFEQPLSTYDVARRLVEGDFGNDLIKFTHYEGERATSIADTAEAQLINFDKEQFLARAIPLEGKLYPETYHIPKTFTADELVDLMLKTYNDETAPVQAKMDTHPLTANGVLILASILEREANSPESMKMVSGILQNRMRTNMRLQADASVEYILNKPLKELTAEDLKVDSPYNTYTNDGLPPTPIGNPGLDAITAVLEPEVTDNFFYITDSEGNFHYAKTFDEHRLNVEKYLR